jgi:hypothetical protein
VDRPDAPRPKSSAKISRVAWGSAPATGGGGGGNAAAAAEAAGRGSGLLAGLAVGVVTLAPTLMHVALPPRAARRRCSASLGASLYVDASDTGSA